MSKKIELLRSIAQTRLDETAGVRAEKEQAAARRNDPVNRIDPAITPITLPAAWQMPRQTPSWIQTLAVSGAIITLLSLNIVLALKMRSSSDQIAGLNEKLEILHSTVMANAEQAAPIAGDVKSLGGTITQLQNDMRELQDKTVAAQKTFQSTIMSITELEDEQKAMARDIRNLKLMSNIAEAYKAPQPRKKEGGY